MISDDPQIATVQRKVQVSNIDFGEEMICFRGMVIYYASDGSSLASRLAPRLFEFTAVNTTLVNKNTGDFTDESDPDKVGEFDYYMNHFPITAFGTFAGLKAAIIPVLVQKFDLNKQFDR